MSNSSNYDELLRDPRWKKRRKQIINRDNKTCTQCGSTKNLRVHHIYYVEGAMPWEYPDEALVTLCETCHNDYHKKYKNIVKKKEPAKVSKRKPKIKLHNLSSFNELSILKVKKNKKRGKRKPRVCLATIQADKEHYKKLDDGTWVRK